MSDFAKEIHNMFDHIWDCEIDHPVYQDTVGELMEAVIQVYEKHKPTLSTNLAEVGTDCISRQAAIDAVMECYDNDELFEVYEWKLNELPTIQPKRGKWIYQIGMVKCDQCLRAIRRIDHDGLLNFCPNCGAKMEGADDE